MVILILYEKVNLVDIVHNCRLLGAVDISQIHLVPSFAADMLKKEQGMLVADVYMLCLRHNNMLKQCSPPFMILLMRNKVKHAISYASIMGLSLAACSIIKKLHRYMKTREKFEIKMLGDRITEGRHQATHTRDAIEEAGGLHRFEASSFLANPPCVPLTRPFPMLHHRCVGHSGLARRTAQVQPLVLG